MTPMYRISQIYDIAETFIMDRGVEMTVTEKELFIEYKFTKNIPHIAQYTLTIVQPVGQVIRPTSGVRDWEVDYKLGRITLTSADKTLFLAQTRHSVGKAGVKDSSKITKAFTRAKSYEFFKLIDLAKKRKSGEIEPINNDLQLFNIVYKLRQLEQ